jgi:hypothetical protein
MMGFGYCFAHPQPPVHKAFFSLWREVLQSTLVEASEPYLLTEGAPDQEVVDSFFTLLS